MGLCFHVSEHPGSDSGTVSVTVHVGDLNPSAVSVGSAGRGSHGEDISNNDGDNQKPAAFNIGRALWKEGTAGGWGWSAVSQQGHSALEFGVCRTQSRQKKKHVTI